MPIQETALSTAFEQPPNSTFVEVTGSQFGSTAVVTGGTQSGTTFSATWTGYSGTPPTVGTSYTISGMTNTANNGTFTATVVTQTGAGSYTVSWVNASGVTEAGSSGSSTRVAGWVGVMNKGLKLALGVILTDVSISGQGGSYTYVH